MFDLGYLNYFLIGVKSIPIKSIPGIEETGWRPSLRGNTQTEELEDIDALTNVLKVVLNAVS